MGIVKTNRWTETICRLLQQLSVPTRKPLQDQFISFQYYSDKMHVLTFHPMKSNSLAHKYSMVWKSRKLVNFDFRIFRMCIWKYGSISVSHYKKVKWRNSQKRRWYSLRSIHEILNSTLTSSDMLKRFVTIDLRINEFKTTATGATSCNK